MSLPSTILLITSVVLLAMLIYIALAKNKRALHYVFMAATVELLIWSIAVLTGLFFTNDIRAFIFVDKFPYIGAAFIPPTLVMLASAYGKQFVGFKKRYVLLFIIPVLSVICVFTNDYHHLFSLSYSAETGYVIGPCFYVYAIYSYVCMIFGMSKFCYLAAKNAGVLSVQSVLNFVGSVIPTVANIGYTFGLPGFSVYSTPAAFTITIFLYIISMFRFDFLKVVPIATQTVVDRISDCFVVVDEQLRILAYNKPFAHRFLAKILGQQKLKLGDALNVVGLSQEQQQRVCDNVHNAIFEKSVFTEDLTVPDETTFHYSVEYTPLLEKGQLPAVVILFRDVTQHVLDLQAIQENQAIILERERLASLGQMIGGIAHNLKSPILSVSGGIDQIRYLVAEYRDSIGDDEVTDDDHREIAKDMDDWLTKMKLQMAYMSDIITTVKGQTAQFNEKNSYPFTVGDALKRSKILMQHSLTENNCTLGSEVLIDPFEVVYGDINSLVQILDNIIDNAIQAYNGKGGSINLTVAQVENEVRFAVQDFGEGIAPEVQKLLFKEMTTTKGKHGTGLGLYMSYSTVKGLFRGNMWFDSTPGKGTTFFVQIPLATK